MTVTLHIVLPTFFLTCVTLFMTFFDFMFSISATLGYFRLTTSDCSTLGAWLKVTFALLGDAILLVSFRWGGWNMLWILLILSLVLSHLSRNGVLGWGFFCTVMRSCVNCVSLSSDYVCGMFTCAGNNPTMLLTLSSLVVGMYQ